MNAPFIAPRVDPAPIEIDPRPCTVCGLTIDRHIMVDDGEGPEFFCADEDRSVADIVRGLELADFRDSWRHTGEAPRPPEVRNGPLQPEPTAAPPRYRTPQSTVDAFLYVVRLDDPEYLARWLAGHKRDAGHLLKIWKARQC